MILSLTKTIIRGEIKMFLAYNWSAVWQSVEDTWLPILIPIGFVILVIVIVAIVKGKKKD